MMELVITTGATRRAELQLNRHQQQQTNCLQTGCPSCRPTNSVKAVKGIKNLNKYQIGTALNKAHTSAKAADVTKLSLLNRRHVTQMILPSGVRSRPQQTVTLTLT